MTQHTLCCDPYTGICGTAVTDEMLATLGLPCCATCAELAAANVPCSLGCPFTTEAPAALKDPR